MYVTRGMLPESKHLEDKWRDKKCSQASAISEEVFFFLCGLTCIILGFWCDDGTKHHNEIDEDEYEDGGNDDHDTVSIGGGLFCSIVLTKWPAGRIQRCREMLWSVCCRAPALSPAKVTFGHDASFMWQVFHDSYLGLDLIAFSLVAVQIRADWLWQVQINSAHLKLLVMI